MTVRWIRTAGPTRARLWPPCAKAWQAEYASMICGTYKTTSCSCSAMDFLAKLGSQFAQSPMAASDIVANIGDVSSLSMERFHLLESQFYLEVLKPFGL
jgi:hypothetical protein